MSDAQSYTLEKHTHSLLLTHTSIYFVSFLSEKHIFHLLQLWLLKLLFHNVLLLKKESLKQPFYWKKEKKDLFIHWFCIFYKKKTNDQQVRQQDSCKTNHFQHCHHWMRHQLYELCPCPFLHQHPPLHLLPPPPPVLVRFCQHGKMEIKLYSAAAGKKRSGISVCPLWKEMRNTCKALWAKMCRQWGGGEGGGGGMHIILAATGGQDAKSEESTGCNAFMLSWTVPLFLFFLSIQFESPPFSVVQECLLAYQVYRVIDQLVFFRNPQMRRKETLAKYQNQIE